MAELALSAVGTAGLIGVFNAVVEDITYIQFAKDIGSDVESYALLLSNSALRVSRWGETVGLSGDALDVENLDGHFSGQSMQQNAERTLGQINELIKEGRDKYGKVMAEDSSTVGTDDVTKLSEKARRLSLARRASITLPKQATWVLVHKKRFEHKIDLICKLSQDLLEFCGTVKSLDQAVKEELRELGENLTVHMLKALQDKEAKMDKSLEQALKDLQATNGATNIRIDGGDAKGSTVANSISGSTVNNSYQA